VISELTWTPNRRFDAAFALRTLHHISIGLQQLHKVGIAHQDLKPSNVLVFPRDEGSKISDFGRAWSKDFRAPHDDYQIPGDMSYAPPELLYGDVATDVNRRRYGCDVYHLGSMAVFLFTRVHMNALLVKHMAPEHRPFTWGGPYSAVLPYVQAAYALALAEFIDYVPDYLQNDFAEAIGQLCEPDAARRGHPLNRQGHVNQFGLDRYVSKFNLLSARAELRMIGGAK